MIRKKRESLFEFSSKNIDLSIYYRHKIQTFKQIDGTITRRILKIYHSISSNPRMLSRLVQGSQTLDRFDPETLLLLLLLRCIVDSLREQIRDILDRSHENYLFFRKSETRQLVSNVKSREPLTDVRSSSDRRGGMRNITTLNYPLSPRIAFGIADFPPWTFKFHLPTHYVTRSTNSWNHLIASASRRPSVPPPEKLTPHYQQQVEQSTSHFPALPSSVFIHGSKGPQG